MQEIKKRHIFFIFGTRPEAIKIAPVILEANKIPHLKLTICITGQHKEILHQALQIFSIKPDIDLNIMEPNQSLASITSNLITKLTKILEEHKPDCVVVHGDTTTTMAASLAAYYAKISVAHVEAGLRTGDIYSPWPEEINRKITTSIAKFHFCPTAKAQENLLNEGIPTERIHITGNTAIDALKIICEKLRSNTVDLKNTIKIRADKKLILVTSHRRENFGEKFQEICEALLMISQRTDVQIVYPVHPNPNIKETAFRLLGNTSNIILTQPLDYLPFVDLMQKSTIILTDSGGIQEEAPSLGKPVLVMRESTERPEATDAGLAQLVGTNKFDIKEAVINLLDNTSLYKKMTKSINPYGDGMAAKRIANELAK